MKRLWKSDIIRAKPKTLTPDFPKLTRATHTRTPLQGPLNLTSMIDLFPSKVSKLDSRARKELIGKVSLLRDELLRSGDDADKVVRALEEKGESFLWSYSNGSAFIELLKQLRPWPSLGLQVCFWVFPFVLYVYVCYVWF